tara:strand:+ start:862 stop:1500 length:639 start_codon:yes stop_codon:yes gene_type:complete
MKRKTNSFDNPIIVIANGSFPSHPLPIDYLENQGTIICADGAADKLIRYGKIPDIVIGDFDSTKIKNNDAKIEWIEKPNQNKTDLEKIFEWCIDNNIKNIVLLGAGGNREDHTLGNLFTLAKYYEQLNCEIITNHSKIICVSGKNHISTYTNQDVSIIATEPIESITLEGLQYDMKNEKIYPSARAISNKATSKQFYLETTGKVLVFLNHDK